MLFHPSQAASPDRGAPDDALYDSDGSSTEAPSLSDMRSFIDRMQSKYSLSQGKAPSAAQQKLAQLRQEAAAARVRSAQAGRGASCSSGAGSEADSEEFGEHRAAALQQGRLQVGARGAGSSDRGSDEDDDERPTWAARNCMDSRSSGSPAASAVELVALAQRLAVAEAKVERLAAVERELAQVKAHVEELKEQHAALQSGARARRSGV